jgi:IS5 family transposase
LSRGGLPPGAQTGYVYDWLGQRQRKTEKQKKRKRKLRKRISKLSKAKKKARSNSMSKIRRTVENTVKRFEEEKRHLEGIK